MIAKFLVGSAVPADFREDSADTAGIVAHLLQMVRLFVFRSGNRITFRFAERSGITDYNVTWQPSLLVMDVGP